MHWEEQLIARATKCGESSPIAAKCDTHTPIKSAGSDSVQDRGKDRRMATDYDAPRKNEEESSEDSLEELKSRRNDKNSGKVDEDEVEAAESFELPGADLSHEELTVRVLPKQADEFTCASCFLVKASSQLAETKNNLKYCVDCV